MQIYTTLAAINTFFITLRVFDFINKRKNLKIISNTLLNAREDLIYFIIIFLTFFFGFVGMSYLSFGTQLRGYDTLISSFKTNFLLNIGEFDFNMLYRVNPIMNYFYFYLFNFVFVFILTNIFKAIIN